MQILRYLYVIDIEYYKIFFQKRMRYIGLKICFALNLTMVLKFDFSVLDLVGMCAPSSNFLGTGHSTRDDIRRKSDSRLDSRQINHLQNMAAYVSSNGPKTTYHTIEKKHEQQNFNSIPPRGDNSNFDTEYAAVEYDRRSNLGPFQISPPQTTRNQHLDCEFPFIRTDS